MKAYVLRGTSILGIQLSRENTHRGRNDTHLSAFSYMPHLNITELGDLETVGNRGGFLLPALRDTTMDFLELPPKPTLH